LSKQNDPPLPLEGWLAAQGPPRAETAVRILMQLAVQLAALHDRDQWHGCLSLAAVAMRDETAVLVSPKVAAETITVEGDGLPPELRDRQRIELPAALSAAAAVLSQSGAASGPRRIDVYQLGVLAVWMVAGASVEEYLYRPSVSGRVPAGLRRVLDRALGFSEGQRLADCRQFLDALPSWQTAVPAHQQETPSRGVSIDGSDTDITGPGDLPMRAAASDDLPFSQLGQYQIVARLGSGGMGDVYKGYDESLGRYVAIKVLPPELARSEDYVTRFRHEASAAAKVEHPHVVPIYTIGSDRGRHFFAMQFVEGQTLAELLHDRPRPPLDWTLRIVTQVLEGLGSAHRRGLIHRDIKPANVLLADGGQRALVADFGLVKTAAQETRMTATGVIMGTVDYISPEQGRGKLVDQRSDLYSIGVLLYQMLAGRLPFQADTPTAMIFQHAYEPPPPLAEAAPDIPADLARLVHRLLAKSPLDRYQTCEELLSDLQAIRSGQAPRHLASAPDIRQTAVIFAPQFAEDRSADAEEAAAAIEQTWQQTWEKWHQRLLLWIGRRAPQFVRQLQNTQQQVDVAVLDYEDRCASLRRLVQEADDVQRVLAAQIVEHQRAAQDARQQAEGASGDGAVGATAAQHQNEEAAAELSRQLASQREQLEQMQLALAKASAKLARLKGQRDALNARLKLAQARYGLHDARPRRRLAPRLALAIACGLVAVVLAGIGWKAWIAPRFASTVVNKEPPDPEPATPGDVQTNTVTLAVDSSTQSVRFPVEVRSLTWMEINSGTYYLLLGGEDGTVWEGYVRGGELYEKFRRAAAHSEPVNGLDFSRQSQRLVSGGEDGQVLIWEKRLGHLSRRLSHATGVTAVSFSPLGDQLLAGTRGDVHCWDIATGSELQRWKLGNISRGGLAWLPDQSEFLLGIDGSLSTGSAFFIAADGGPHPLVGSVARLRDTAVFRGGETIAALAENTVSVWDRRDEGPSRKFGTDVTCAAFSEFGFHTLTGHRDGSVNLWNTFTGEVIHEVVKLPARVAAVSMTPRGEFGAAVCESKEATLRIFPLLPERVPGMKKSFYTPAPIQTLCFAPYAAGVVSMDQFQVRNWTLEADRDAADPLAGVIPGAACIFAPDGEHVLIAQSQSDREGYGTITLSKLRKGPIPGIPQFRRYRGHQGGTTAALFVRPGARIVSGGNDNQIRIWDTRSEQEAAQFDVGTPVRALGLAGDRPGEDGRVVVVGDAVDVGVWNLATHQRVGNLQGHSLPPRAVAVAHKADRAVTISSDRTARVWDLATLQPVATFTLESVPTTVAITPDGAQIVTGSRDGVVQVWNVADQSAGKIVGWHNGSVTALTLSVHDRSIVSAGEDQVLCWWDFPKDGNK
jgi:serine/threonine protein kinase/WD40 repeat protein